MSDEYTTATKRIGRRNSILLNRNEMKSAGTKHGDIIEIKFKRKETA
jgi:hypothetical protein